MNLKESAEFDYAKNLASILHLYNAYRINNKKNNFEQLAIKIKARNKMIDSWFNKHGKMKKISDWPEIKFMGNVSKSCAMTNEILSATISAPFNWSVVFLQKNNILLGTCKKSLKISSQWGKWHKLRVIQLGKIGEQTRFRVRYDYKNIIFKIESDLDSKVKITPTGSDGRCWRQDCFELMLAPLGIRKIYYHFIINPVQNSYYDAVFGLITDLLHPCYNKSDSLQNPGGYLYIALSLN